MAQEPVALPLDTSVSAQREPTGSIQDETQANRSISSSLFLIASRVALALAILVLVAAAGLYTFRSTYADKVYPSVYVQHVNVGGMSYSEAKSAVESDANTLLGSQLTFTYEGRRWSPTFAELGVSLDLSSTLDTAFAIGREDDARERVGSTLGLANGRRTVGLAFTFDEKQFNNWLDQVDSDLGQPSQDAAIVVSDGKIETIQDRDGLVVDRERARLLVVSGLQAMTPYAGDLPTIADPANVHVADLASAIQTLEQALDSSIKLAHNKDRWRLTSTDLGQFVHQTVNPDASGAAAVKLSIDRDGLASYLNALLKEEVNINPKDAVVAWDFKKNRVKAMEKSKTGTRVKPAELADAVIAAFWGKKKLVEIPVAVVQPDVDSSKLDRLGITTKLAVGDSNFDGSESGRATNIAVGASLLNGTLIGPKSEFSFNHSIGEITGDLGYVDAPVVDGERIGKDIGGGICQVSTTVFRAAFFAGLPITEWHPHRYRLGFYELDGYAPGLDASILQPEGNPFGGGDFKFENPSDSWMLIESYVDGPRVYVIIYGPDLGYTVQVSEPWYPQEVVPPTEDLEIVDDQLPAGTIQQSEYAQSGMEVAYQRTVFDKDGNQLWDRTFDTYFYSRGNVYKVSPDMRGQSPAA